MSGKGKVGGHRSGEGKAGGCRLGKGTGRGCEGEVGDCRLGAGGCQSVRCRVGEYLRGPIIYWGGSWLVSSCWRDERWSDDCGSSAGHCSLHLDCVSQGQSLCMHMTTTLLHYYLHLVVTTVATQ